MLTALSLHRPDPSSFQVPWHGNASTHPLGDDPCTQPWLHHVDNGAILQTGTASPCSLHGKLRRRTNVDQGAILQTGTASPCSLHGKLHRCTVMSRASPNFGESLGAGSRSPRRRASRQIRSCLSGPSQRGLVPVTRRSCPRHNSDHECRGNARSSVGPVLNSCNLPSSHVFLDTKEMSDRTAMACINSPSPRTGPPVRARLPAPSEYPNRFPVAGYAVIRRCCCVGHDNRDCTALMATGTFEDSGHVSG